jgi:hypothetical protein
MRVGLKFKLASIRDFKWWMEKDDLRFTHIISLMWVSLLGDTARVLTLILGPLSIKLYITSGVQPRGPQDGGKG